MKLLIITQKVDADAPILGYFHRWIERFSEEVSEVSVICLEEGRHELPSNVTVFSLGKEDGAGRLRRLVRFYIYVLQLFFTGRVSGVFIHMNEIYAYLLLPLRPLFMATRVRIGFWKAHGRIGCMARFARHLVDYIFTTNEKTYAVETRKRVISGNGIALERFPFLKERSLGDPVRLLAVGRVTRVKGYEAIIEGLAALRDQDILARLTIVDGGTHGTRYGKRMTALIEKHGLTDLVSFTGVIPQAEMAKVYHEHDILINATRVNTVDKAILEAMATGVIPVVATRALSEVLTPYSFLQFIRDDASSLAMSVATVCKEARRHDVLRNNLRAYVEEAHSLDRLIPRIVSYYS